MDDVKIPGSRHGNGHKCWIFAICSARARCARVGTFGGGYGTHAQDLTCTVYGMFWQRLYGDGPGPWPCLNCAGMHKHTVHACRLHLPSAQHKLKERPRSFVVERSFSTSSPCPSFPKVFSSFSSALRQRVEWVSPRSRSRKLARTSTR